MTPRSIAFLTIMDCLNENKVGGLLVIDPHGRPQEFHCTEPVAPNRAQRILYGKTLPAFFCGELIAPALLKKLPTHAGLVITDVLSVMLARDQIKPPMVSLVASDVPCTLHELDVQRSELNDRAVLHRADFDRDGRDAQAVWQRVGRWVDLDEPLERINMAIAEAQRSAA